MLAVTSLKRYPAVPDVPAMAETVPGFDVTWYAVFIAPIGVPAAINARLTAELVAITKEPEMLKRLDELGVTPSSVSGPELEAQIKADYATWQPIVEKAKIPPP